MNARSLLPLTFAASLATGCYVSADLPEISSAVQLDPFPGAGDAAGTSMSQSRQFKAALPQELAGLVKQATMKKISLLPKSGVDNLDFLDGAEVVWNGDNGDVTIADFAKATDAASTGAIDVNVRPGVDLTAALKQGAMFTATLDVLAPAVDWSLEVDIHFAAKI